MNHRLARTFSVSAALATAGVVCGNAVVSHGTPASASATSSSASTPGGGSTDSSAASTNPGGATPASTVPVTPTPVAGSATQFSLVAGDAATVILDTNGGVLRIVAFAPHPGWFTVRLEQPSLTDLSAQLETGSSQVTLTARLAAGALSAELASGPATSSGPGSSSPDGSTPVTGPDGSSSTSIDGSSTSSTSIDGSSTSSSSPEGSTSTSSPDDTDPDDGDNSGPGGGDGGSGSG